MKVLLDSLSVGGISDQPRCKPTCGRAVGTETKCDLPLRTQLVNKTDLSVQLDLLTFGLGALLKRQSLYTFVWNGPSFITCVCVI